MNSTSMTNESKKMEYNLNSLFKRTSQCLILFSIPFFIGMVSGQGTTHPVHDQGYLALYQAITDLKSDFTLMSVAAHPDDEHIQTLTYYRRGRGVRTVVVAATRGEGGQNEIGPELYRELGVIRTHEMQRAGEISGAEYYNLNLEDFGYSRSAEEALRKWGREQPLKDMVFLIRKLRPDVIITNHDTHSGHGQHQATGILIRQAFDLAADSTKFPEQLQQGVGTWQPLRLFQRVFTAEDADVAIPVGNFDPVRGESYAQIAGRALTEHRSQGMEFFAESMKRGPRFTYYKLIKPVVQVKPDLADLFEGLPGLWPRLQEKFPDQFQVLNQLERERQHAIAVFSEDPPELTAALLQELQLWRDLASHVEDSSGPDGDIIRQEQKLQEALFRSLHLDFDLQLSDRKVIRNQNLKMSAVFFNGGQEKIALKSIEIRPRNEWFNRPDFNFYQPVSTSLAYNQSDTVTFNFRIPESANFTVPKTEILYKTFHWQPLLKAVVQYDFDGVNLSAGTEADLDIVPDLAVRLVPQQRILPMSFRGKEIHPVVQITNNAPDSVSGAIRLAWGDSTLMAGNGNAQSFELQREDEETAVRFALQVPSDLDIGDYKLNLSCEFEHSYGNKTITSEGLIRAIDVATVPDVNVGIIKSYDNTLQNALEQMGVTGQALTSEDLRWGNLSKFDTIILDIRAYLVRADLRQNNGRLLQYVKNGGNLIVMYQKVFEWNPEYGNPQWAPYPLLLSHERVTDEDAPVTVLQPQHPLLNSPNKITGSDWQGWMQERGLYFPIRWDPKYEALLALSDPGEPPLQGSYLVARYGKGSYIYTSLVWYRELRALAPGAFRNLANMIGYAKTGHEE